MNDATYPPIVEDEIQPAEMGELAAEFHFGSPEFHFLAAKFEFGDREFHFGNPEFHFLTGEFHFGNAEFHFPAREFEFGSPEFHFLSPDFHFGIAEFEFGARFTPMAAALLPGELKPREKESSPTYRFLGRVSVSVYCVMSATDPSPPLPGTDRHHRAAFRGPFSTRRRTC